jgi:hypothetical protein
MSIDISVLEEAYQTLKQYIPQKDRQEASDALMSILSDYLSDADIKEFSGLDSYTKRSFEEYAAELDEDDDSDNDW